MGALFGDRGGTSQLRIEVRKEDCVILPVKCEITSVDCTLPLRIDVNKTRLRLRKTRRLGNRKGESADGKKEEEISKHVAPLMNAIPVPRNHKFFWKATFFWFRGRTANNSRRVQKVLPADRTFGLRQARSERSLTDNPTGHFAEADPIALAFTPTADR